MEEKGTVEKQVGPCGLCHSLRMNWRVQEGFEQGVTDSDFNRIPLALSKDELMRVDGIIASLSIPFL